MVPEYTTLSQRSHTGRLFLLDNEADEIEEREFIKKELKSAIRVGYVHPNERTSIMENKPNTSTSNLRDQNQRNSTDKKQGADQNQKGDQGSNRNDMPPIVAGDKLARPDIQNPNIQRDINEKPDDEDLEAEEGKPDEEGEESEETTRDGNKGSGRFSAN